MKRSDLQKRLKGALEYYDSNDFKDNYSESLFSDLYYNGRERLQQRYFDNTDIKSFVACRGNFEQIVQYIENHSACYVRDFRNYSIGDAGGNSIASVSFGEQEEHIEGCNFNEFTMDYIGTPLDFVYNKTSNAFYRDLTSDGICIKVTEDEMLSIIKELGGSE